jgi:hypothetical protein
MNHRFKTVNICLHVRMDDERMVKRVFLGNSGGRRKPGRPRLRWLDCVEDT